MSGSPPVRRTSFGWTLLVGAWAVFALTAFFQSYWVPWKDLGVGWDNSLFPPVGWFPRLGRLADLARGPLVGLSAVAILLYWGEQARHFLRWDLGDKALRVAADFALGGLLLNLVWLGLGWTHLWREPVVVGMAVLLGVPALLALGPAERRGWAGKTHGFFSWGEHGLFGNLLMGLVFLYVGISFAHALLPALSRDADLYHLAFLAHWKSLGALTLIPGQSHAFHPLGGPMVLMNGFWFGSEEGAKLVNVATWAFAGMAFYGWAREAAGAKAAAFAAGFFWTFPALALGAWNARIEGFLALYFVLCLWALDRCLAAVQESHRASFFLMACLFGAGAFAVSYVAVVFLAALVVVGAYLLRRGSLGILPRGAGWMGLGAGCVVVAPWLIRNLVLQGAPLAPFLGAVGDPGGMSVFGHERMLAEYQGLVEGGGLSFLTWPFHRLTQTRDLGESGGPFFLVFLPLLFLLRPAGPSWRLPFHAWWVALLAGSLVTHVFRFHAPVMALGFVWAAVALFRHPPRPWAPGLATLALFLSGLLCLPAIAHFSAVDFSPMGMWSGREDRAAYLARAMESSYAPLAEAARRLTPPNARLLVVGDGRSLRYPRVAYAQSPYDRQLIVRWLREDPSEDALRRGLRRLGVDHVVVSGHEAARRGREGRLFDLSPEEARRMDRLLRQVLVPLETDKWGGLYRVSSGASEGSTTAEPQTRPFQLLSPPGCVFAEARESGDLARAEKALDDLLLYFPQEGYWHGQRARVRMSRGDRGGACSDLEEARRLGVDHTALGEWRVMLRCP